MSESGRYLFAVARDLPLPELAGVTGLRGQPLELVSHRELQAVVCDVDLTEFGEDGLTRNLEDLAWLEEVARAHNDVVFAAAAVGTVAPMRLVTICADDESVRSRIEGLYDQLTTALDRVEGRREWSVKVYGPPADQADSRSEAPKAAVGSGPGAGAAYLRARREQVSRRQATQQQALEAGDAIHAELGTKAVATRRLAQQDPRLSGRSEPMLLNAAYLVPIEEGPQFRSFAEQLRARYPNFAVEIEGPWPPYSFATLD
jgi:hypothetical protein